MVKYFFCFFISSICVFWSCRQGPAEALFVLQTGTNINFINNLVENKDFNVFSYRNFYNGGGVAIGDVNNDGLADVFFTGNQVGNKLYLNKGSWIFDDISQKSGFGDKRQWSTGVVMVDINADGWLDIYVCNAGNMMDSSLRKNQLFINNHDLTFTERAGEYGLDNDGYTTQASFFDYDLDGDLDCFMVNNSPIPVNTLNYANQRQIPAEQWDVAPFLRGGGDHLYRNDNGKFIEVTQSAGIHGSLISLGLGINISDLNGDNYLDIYVSNDFFEKDYLYINQKDGTFKDEIESRIQHTSLASMGADIQDINNDGCPDIFTTDMLPDDEYRLKTTSQFDNYDVFHLKEKSGFHKQFMQNTIQLNNKNGMFMEIANYSKVQASDWSWGGLLFDADNDGYNDLYICNGIAHDLTDQDFLKFFADEVIQNMALNGKKDEIDLIVKKMPSHPLKNKMYQNNGNLRFADIGDKWGLTQTSFSNGAAYGDMDNDGDLDLIVNNVNSPAFIYRNNSIETNGQSYIGFVLKGNGGNTFSIGAKVEVYAGNKIFVREQVPCRGFQSSMDYKLIIGLGSIKNIDSVRVVWPGNTYSTIKSLAVNQTHTIQQGGGKPLLQLPEKTSRPLFLEVENVFEKHEDDNFVDFYFQRNIPMMLSKEGPKAAVADVNNDGRTDIYICGANKKGGNLYLQSPNGGFIKHTQLSFQNNTDFEETACLFFDCDKDGDFDLYIGAGGNNQAPKSHQLSHRLFKNNGKGGFTLFQNAFSPNASNIGAVAANDFDKDGDIDLYIGGRSASYKYGISPTSYLFINNGLGQFADNSHAINNEISELGMITGAIWVDVFGDAKEELIIAGEMMHPHVFTWVGNKLQKKSTNLDSLLGCWQTITTADLNQDGKQDLVLGNLGENGYLNPTFQSPVKLWTNIFAMDGTPQVVLSKTVHNKDVPVFLKNNLEDQFPGLKKQNLRHDAFANKSIQELFAKNMMETANLKTYNYCSSIIAWNNGNGNFEIEKLPPEVQFSSANAIQCLDINFDDKPDLIVGGNQFGFVPQFGTLDANYGIVLLNTGNKNFTIADPKSSGIQITGQVRDIKLIKTGKEQLVLFLRNDDSPMLFKIAPPSQNF